MNWSAVCQVPGCLERVIAQCVLCNRLVCYYHTRSMAQTPYTGAATAAVVPACRCEICAPGSAGQRRHAARREGLPF